MSEINRTEIIAKQGDKFSIKLSEGDFTKGSWKFKISPENGITFIDVQLSIGMMQHVWGYKTSEETGLKQYFEKDVYSTSKEWHFIGNIVGEYVILFEYSNNKIINETKEFKIKITE